MTEIFIAIFCAIGNLLYSCLGLMGQLYKLASAELCSGVTGQVMTSLMLRPPQPGDESYPLYKEEVDKIFNGLKERSRKLVEGLNKIPGITCQPADGAMYGKKSDSDDDAPLLWAGRTSFPFWI